MLKANIYKIDPEATIEQMHEDDIGYDISAINDYTICKYDYVAIKTGISIKPPKGYHFEIALRSSIPNNYGLLIPNGVGIIDPSYCGPEDELAVLVFKFKRGKKDFFSNISFHDKNKPVFNKHGNTPQWVSYITKGTRIGQLILRKTNYVKFVEYLPSKNNRGGFGSTDKQ